MSEERREGTPDWSRFDPHEAEREARRAERDAHDAAREQARAARDQERASRQQERAARDQEREAERMTREAERERRREERREERRGHRLHMRAGGFAAGFPFDPAEFTKGFMKDFVSDAMGDTYDETVNGEFTVEGMPRLRVRNISGDTTIKVGDPGKITVVATKHVSASSEDRAKRLLQNLEIRMEKHGDELRVEPHLYEQERGWVDLFRGKRFRVDFEITVPAQCGVDAQTVSGDLSVSGTQGPLEIQSTSGDVSLTDAQGPLRLKSVSGDVSVTRYVGHVEGNTVSGDVTFNAVRVRSMQLHTVSGDIELAGALEAAREHRIRTISGDVDLALVDPDLLVEFRTASGDLETEIEGRVTRHGRHEYSVALGNARGHVVVKTVSGDVSIDASVVEVPGEPSTEEPRRAGEAGAESEPEEAADADVERTEPMDTGPSEEVRAVLDRLAKGELNVEDAAAALDAARRAR